MTSFTHDFEAPAGDGTAITAGNSGGGGRTAFDAVSATASQTLEVDTAIFKADTQSGLFKTNGVAGGAYVVWNGAGLVGVPVIYATFYVQVDVSPTAFHALFRAFNGGASCFQLGLDTLRRFQMLDANAGLVTAHTLWTLATATWARVDVGLELSPVGGWHVRTFSDPDSPTPAQETSGAGRNFSGLATEYRFGMASTGPATSAAVSLDGIEVNNTGVSGVVIPPPAAKVPGRDFPPARFGPF